MPPPSARHETPVSPPPPRPAVPLALWPVAPPAAITPAASQAADGSHVDHARGLTAQLARRIVAEYSQPGDTVLDLVCTGGTLVAEAAAGRRQAVGVAHDDRLAAAAIAHCEQILAPGSQSAVEVITADVTRLPQLRPELTGSGDLAVLTLPEQTVAAGSPGFGPDLAALTGTELDNALAATFEASWWLLRPGGLLVTVTRSTRRGNTFRDTAGALVRLAGAAGFGYTQHVIALSAAIDGDHLTAHPSREDLARLRADKRAGRPHHLVVHHDVCVFQPLVGLRQHPHPDPDGPPADTREDVIV